MLVLATFLAALELGGDVAEHLYYFVAEDSCHSAVRSQYYSAEEEHYFAAEN